MVSSVDGLISGLSTSSLITQLMQVEASGQSRLKTKVTTQQRSISAYQTINSRIAALTTAATALTETAAWKPVKATSSSTAAAVIASAGAATGELTFNVDRLAKAQMSTAAVAATGSIQDGTGVKLTIGGVETSIVVGALAVPPTADTAQGVVDAINAKNLDVKAALVTTEHGSVLQLTSNKTGAANSFSLTGLVFNPTVVTAAGAPQVSVGTVAMAGSIQDGTGVKVTVGATTYNIAVADDTAQGVADAINAAGINVAVAVDSAGVMSFTANAGGAANNFSVSGLVFKPNTMVAAADARISVGSPSTGGYTLVSATNTFADVLPKLSITVSKEESNVTVSVARDANSLATKMQTMVDAANAALSEISTQAKQGSATTTGGVLAGNSMVRGTAQSILSTVASGNLDLGSYKKVGIELDRAGRLTFDKAAFLAGYADDPVKAEAGIRTGLATAITTATGKAKTNLENAVQSGNTMVTSFTDQIANWDIRLKTREAALQRQFSNLEVSLSRLKNQSSWLAGQVSSLG